MSLCMVTVAISVVGSVQCTSMDRQCFGHSCTQEAHWMQLYGLMVQSPALRSTVMAPAGHARWHMPHMMHSSTSFTT